MRAHTQSKLPMGGPEVARVQNPGECEEAQEMGMERIAQYRHPAMEGRGMRNTEPAHAHSADTMKSCYKRFSTLPSSEDLPSSRKHGSF